MTREMNFLEGQNVSSSTWQLGILVSLEETAILCALSKAEKYWEIETKSRETAGSLITLPHPKHFWKWVIFESLVELFKRHKGQGLPWNWSSFKTEPEWPLQIYPRSHVWSFPIKPQSKRKSCFPETGGKTPSGQDAFLNKLQFTAEVQSHSVPDGL